MSEPQSRYKISRFSVTHLKRRAILRPGLAVIVNPRRGNIRMPLSHSCTLAMSAPLSSAFVAAVARITCGPMFSPKIPSFSQLLQHYLLINTTRCQRRIGMSMHIVLDGSRAPAAGCPALHTLLLMSTSRDGWARSASCRLCTLHPECALHAAHA